GEFNGDGRLDLVTRTGVAAQDFDGDGVNDYFLTFLPGCNNGVFGAQTRLKIGDTANNQAFPRALAAGQFNNDNRRDLVVGGSNGITVVNHNNANGFVFTATFVASTGINTLATGVVRNSFAFSDDIVATSNAGRLVVFMNDGAGTFRPFNGNAAYTGGGQWFNLALNSGTGAVTAASNTTPIVITSNAHRLTTGQLVTITGVNGNTAANGTFTITVIDANNFSLNGSAGNGIYT